MALYYVSGEDSTCTATLKGYRKVAADHKMFARCCFDEGCDANSLMGSRISDFPAPNYFWLLRWFLAGKSEIRDPFVTLTEINT